MLFGKLFTNPKMWLNGDADDITMGGVYTCKDVQNVPTGDGALFVFKTENTVKQVFIPVGEEGVVYTRVLGEEWASVTGTSEETEALIQSAIDKANQAQAKANTVDTRLNNIIVESGTSDAEVVAARTDSNGQTFTTLGARLDTQFGKIKEDLNNVIDTMDATPLLESAVELGIFTGTTGAKYDSTISLRTKRYYLRSQYIGVFAKSGYELRIYAYNKATKEYVGVWNGTEFVKVSSLPSSVLFYLLSDEYAYKFTFRKTDGATASYDGIIFVKNPKTYCEKVVVDISSNELVNGIPSSSENWEIAANSNRLTNWNPIPANKGDIVRINDLSLMGWIREFDANYNLLAQTSTYQSPVWIGGTYNLCGDYVVRNDCYISVQLAPRNGVTVDDMSPSAHDKAFSVIHMQSVRTNRADDTLKRFPKSARKAKRLSTEAIVSQACTFINGMLWASVDGDTDYFQVINPETGAIIKTVTHNFGHCNCLDYCTETDTLMTKDPSNSRTILLYPNVSEVNDSMSKSDAISVTMSADDIDAIGSYCFGENSTEVFAFTGKGSANPFNLYKLKLGYTNNAYDGTYTITKTYTGVILDNVDSYVTFGTENYAQDSCYDGYLYLAYGTSGHNFLVIDIDDTFNRYRVVGNYIHHEYKSDGTEYGIEPEGVAINDGELWCLSRQNTAHLYYFIHYRM